MGGRDGGSQLAKGRRLIGSCASQNEASTPATTGIHEGTEKGRKGEREKGHFCEQRFDLCGYGNLTF